MKKEIPILMQTEMVQATIEGRKSMTRRTKGLEFINESSEDFHPHQYLGVNEDGLHLMKNNYGATNAIKCPYGKPGDLLWVRESGWVDNNYMPGLNEPHLYWKADYEKYDDTTKALIKEHTCRFPSIHMYKSFARIWLLVTDIRIERLHDITPYEAGDEGVEYWNVDAEAFEGGEFVADYKNYMWRDDEKYEEYHFPTYSSPCASFFSLWEKINGKKSLDANPWLWVVSFKVISTKGKPHITQAKNYDFNSRNNLETSHF